MAHAPSALPRPPSPSRCARRLVTVSPSTLPSLHASRRPRTLTTRAVACALIAMSCSSLHVHLLSQPSEQTECDPAAPCGAVSTTSIYLVVSDPLSPAEIVIESIAPPLFAAECRPVIDVCSRAGCFLGAPLSFCNFFRTRAGDATHGHLASPKGERPSVRISCAQQVAEGSTSGCDLSTRPSAQSDRHTSHTL